MRFSETNKFKEIVNIICNRYNEISCTNEIEQFHNFYERWFSFYNLSETERRTIKSKVNQILKKAVIK